MDIIKAIYLSGLSKQKKKNKTKNKNKKNKKKPGWLNLNTFNSFIEQD